MRQDLTDITIVLDRSGSMQSVRDDTIGGFNRFLDDQKNTPGAADFTLVQFDHEYEFVHKGKTIGDVPKLDATTYVPRGNTALLDAIGRTINDTGKRLADTPDHDRASKVIFVIITDGKENSSREFTRDKINEMISHQREAYKWEFVFLGANQDAIKVGAGYGVLHANSMTYANNKAGTEAAYASLSSNTRSMRTGKSQTMQWNAADRDAQKKAGASA